MNSIRRAIQLPLVIAVPALALIAGVVASLLVISRLRSDFDTSLQAKAQALVSLTAQIEADGALAFNFDDEAMPEFSRRTDPEYFELWDARSNVIERSRSLGMGHLPRPQSFGSKTVWQNVQLPDGRQGRMIALAFEPAQRDEENRKEAEQYVAETPRGASLSTRGRAEAVLVFARGSDTLQQLIAFIVVAFLGSAAALAAAILILIPRVMDRGLAALGDIAAQVGRIGAERMNARVVLASPVKELTPVVARINALLNDLESALARERRFAADAAHELRTPVAELKSLAEIGQRWPEDRAMTASFFQDAGALAVQMEQTVTQLLALARAEASVDSLVLEKVDLNALLRGVWTTLQPAAADRQQLLRADLNAELVIVTDAPKLEIILRNMLANAVHHSAHGSEIQLTTTRMADGWRVIVANPAPQLEAADMPRLFDRFWRKDPARSGVGHLGMGLALVRAIAQTLGVEVAAELTSENSIAVSLEHRQARRA